MHWGGGLLENIYWSQVSIYYPFGRYIPIHSPLNVHFVGHPQFLGFLTSRVFVGFHVQSLSHNGLKYYVAFSGDGSVTSKPLGKQACVTNPSIWEVLVYFIFSKSALTIDTLLCCKMSLGTCCTHTLSLARPVMNPCVVICQFYKWWHEWLILIARIKAFHNPGVLNNHC